MKAYICDHCDLIMPLDGDKITLTNMHDYEQRFHLCHECYKEFQGWLYKRKEDEHD